MPKYAEEILAAVTELQQHPTAEQVFLEMKRRIAMAPASRITESGSPDRYDRTERTITWYAICRRLPDMQSQEKTIRISYGGEVS